MEKVAQLIAQKLIEVEAVKLQQINLLHGLQAGSRLSTVIIVRRSVILPSVR